MKEKIIEQLKNYSIDKEIIFEFFNQHNLNINKIKDKIITYPCCDLDIIGVYPKIENNILVDYKIRVPKIDNLYNALINIHEIIHGLILENNLNMTYKDNEYEEVLPMLYEDIFVDYLVNNKQYNIRYIYNEYTIAKSNDDSLDERYIKARRVIGNMNNNIKHKIKKLDF